jgi:proteasome lid subunit RPN8/RPN11
MSARPEITIPAAIHAAIREHVAEAPPGHEITGRLVLNAELHGVAYHKMRNGSSEPNRAIFTSSWRREPGRIDILVHSHPDDDPRPSAADLAWSADRTYRGREHRAVFAIWARDMLHVYRVDPETKSFASVPVLMQIKG